MPSTARAGRARPSSPRSTIALSRANREAILDALVNRGPLSRPAIGTVTGMSMATVNRLVSGLMAQGLVVPAGRQVDTGGRPSMVVRVAPRALVTAAVGVGMYTTRTALVDITGETFDVQEHPIDDAGTSNDRLGHTLDAAEAAVARARRQGLRCVGVGVTIQGSVTPDGVIDWAPSLEWRSIPLGTLVTHRVGLPCLVENDANVFAFVEHRRGASAGATCLVALLLTTRVSVGIVVDGHLFRGGRFAAGEIGHMLLEPSSLDRLYPKTGDLETRVGAAGVSARLAALTGEKGAVPVTTGEIFLLASRGSTAAATLAGELLDELALTVANLSVILDPDVVVLCGGLGEHAPLIIPGLVERLTGRIPHLPSITGPSMGDDPWLSGIGIMAREARGSLIDLVDQAPSGAE